MISTIEELSTVEVGQQIVADGQPWERTVEGFRRNGYNVSVNAFAPSLNRGAVVLGAPITGVVTDTGTPPPHGPTTTGVGAPTMNPITDALADYRSRLQTALHMYMNEHDYDHNSDLEDLMQRFAMQPRTREVTVEVEVEGETVVNLSSYNLSDFVDNVTVTGDADVNVRWAKTLEFTRTSSGCVCDDIERHDVYEALSNLDISVDEFDYSTSCTND